MLEFQLKNGTPAIETNQEYSILSHFLMIWDDPLEIVSTLLPLVDKGIIYGVEANYKKIDGWQGYYISSEKCFLEVIDADVAGVAFVTRQETKLFDSSLNHQNLHLDSFQFKEIILRWLDFLLRINLNDINPINYPPIGIVCQPKNKCSK